MKNIALLCIFSVFFLTGTVVSAAPSGEESLTLLNKQPQGNQPTQISPQVPGQVAQSEELHDIYGPVAINEPVPYLLIAGIIVLLLLLVFLFFRFFRKRTKKGPPPVPPWEKALRELAEARSLLNPEHGLAYMDRASTILRHYIESRFSIQSTRQTTREFLKSLRSVTPTSPLNTYKSELQDCLEQADLAKFAHRKPEQQNLETMEEAVTTFVRKTEPTATPEGVKV
ncbi:MAG: DUF4381 family protein [Desulforhopalus sp.]